MMWQLQIQTQGQEAKNVAQLWRTMQQIGKHAHPNYYYHVSYIIIIILLQSRNEFQKHIPCVPIVFKLCMYELLIH